VRLVAGVDGGQSSTVALVADADGAVLGSGRAGPADDVGERDAALRTAAAVDAALDAALDAAGSGADHPLEVVVAAISGYDDARAGRAIPLRPRTLRVVVEHDADAAWRGAFAGREEAGGILVIAGTGSIALGRTRAGAVARAGGWGYLFGDEGSAFWLARRALSLAMARADRGAPSDLASEALRHFAVASLGAVAHGFARGTIDRARIAAFAPRVCALAAAGDTQARVLVGDAADALAELAGVVHARLGTAAPAAVSYHGGLFAATALRDAWSAAVRSRIAGANVVAPVHEPAYGALLRARGLAAEPR
jgi:N-acetylglucosamine kinase-like BadF-type ATPase